MRQHRHIIIIFLLFNVLTVNCCDHPLIVTQSVSKFIKDFRRHLSDNKGMNTNEIFHKSNVMYPIRYTCTCICMYTYYIFHMYRIQRTPTTTTVVESCCGKGSVGSRISARWRFCNGTCLFGMLLNLYVIYRCRNLDIGRRTVKLCS